MNSLRKFVYAAIVAVAALNVAPNLASAQEPARGKFTLTHDVQWGTAKLPAGDYTFAFNVEGVSPVLMLSKISGTPAGYMVLVPNTETVRAAAGSHLELETTADGSYVTAMQLPEFGMVLHFNAPVRAEKQIARAATVVPSPGQ